MRAAWAAGDLAAGEHLLETLCATIGAGGDWLALGRLRVARGDREAARAAFMRSQDHPDTLVAAARALAQLALEGGAPEMAYEALASALERPDAPDELGVDLALAAEHCGREQEARERYDAALGRAPEDRRARTLRAALRRRLGEFDAALADYEVLTAADAGDASSWHAKAECLRQLGRGSEALVACAEALRCDPGNIDARMCQAATLASRGEIDAAQAQFDRLASEDPAALRRYAGAGAGDPVAPDARAVHLVAGLSALALADWRDYAVLLASARRYFRSVAGAPSDPAVAFPSLYLPLTPAETGTAHLAVSSAFRSLRTVPHPGTPAPDGRLRVGYITSKFRDHPGMFLTRGLFRAHDRERYAVTAYALNPDDGGPERRRMAAEFDRFVDLSNLDDEGAARRIGADGTDILIDLNGYSDDARPGVLARRPGTLQLTFIGHMHSLYAPWIDYRVTDHVAEPTDWGHPLLERRVFMPGCLFPYGAEPTPVDNRISRSDLGLPTDAFVLCAFTRLEKVDPAVFTLWMEILSDLQDGVLWLLDPGARGRASLIASARAAGIDPTRLLFAPRLPHARHLLRHRAADLYLDTPIFNAHTTGLDALHAGLPLVTLRGERWVSRIGASLLHAVGLEELIAEDMPGYRELVLRLARERGRLADLTTRLRQRIASARPFSSVECAQRLEQAFEAMWSRHQRGEPPIDIDLST